MKVLSYEEKVKLFGDPKPIPRGNGGFANLDAEFLSNIQFFEFPILGKLQFHKKVFHQLYKVLETIQNKELDKEIDIATTKRLGGTFVPRYQRWDPRYPLSSHAFGIAVDLFSMNSGGDLKKVNWSEEFIKIFEENGFLWGGKFENFFDPIHFEIYKIIL